MGACLRAFPNEFRLYRAGEDRYRRAVSREQAQQAEYQVAPSAEQEALGGLWVRQVIETIADSRTRTAVTASALADYTHEEIRELLDACSTRVIEALLYRWRKKAKSSEGEWRHG